MPGYDATALDAAIDAVHPLITHVGLLDLTATELTGGSPAYARNAVAWAGASGVVDNDDDETFNVPAATTVAFVGGYTASSAGSRRMLWPVQGSLSDADRAPKLASIANSGDLFTSIGHGLANDERVVIADASGAGLPSGLTEDVVYYVVGVSGATFQVSATLAGAAVTISADGTAFVIQCIPETFADQGTYTVPAGALDLAATLL